MADNRRKTRTPPLRACPRHFFATSDTGSVARLVPIRMRNLTRPHPLALLAVAVAVLLMAVAVARTEPAPIEAKRAQVAQLQADLAEIDGRVGAAAERYNGARYRLDQVKGRIETNRRILKENTKALAEARRRLAARLDAIYRQPEPTIVDVIVSSGSLTDAVDQVEMLDRAGEADSRVVGGIRESRRRLEAARAQLREDRVEVERQVVEAERERARVQALLDERRSVLQQAEGELGQLLAEQRERERREAARREAEARAAVAAARAQSRTQAATATPARPAAVPAAAGAAAPVTPALPDADGANGRAAQIALGYLGVPYVWGGASPSGFDCSGLASYSYAQVGKSVPHYTGAIWAAFPRVPSDQLQAGDMVFFRADLGHMGIYIGGGNYVHAPRTGDVVKISAISERSDFVGAVRP